MNREILEQFVSDLQWETPLEMNCNVCLKKLGYFLDEFYPDGYSWHVCAECFATAEKEVAEKVS